MLNKLTNRLERLSDLLNYISKILLGIIVLVMVVIIVTQVFLRYVLHTGLNWPEEVTTFLMAWMTFLGSAIAVKQSDHINIQLFVNLLPKKGKTFVRILEKLITMSFIIFFAYLGYVFAVGSIGYKANTVNLSLFWPRVSLVVSGFLMILHMVVFILKDINGGEKA